ncbi:hypothetical protein FQA39_LY01416 [Lamprigera yunnana]|nr:hypothetical protein FQA39_LY01416 [Lamprigera yunnana]
MHLIVKITTLLLIMSLAAAKPKQTDTALDDAQAEPAARLERQAGGHHHDAVDFGAHTGHKGSFGWYADFPVHSNH